MIDQMLLKSEAENIGVILDETALGRFDRYAQRLVEVNMHLNLTAITEPAEIVYKHFLDSLTVLNAVTLPDSAQCIDVGTGAGFPGAALLIARPDLRMTLLDGTRKKLCFIQDTLDELGLSADVVHMRAEEAGQSGKHREQYDLVTARAVANLRELCEYCIPFTRIGGIFIAMKSVRSEEEIAEAQSAIRLMGGRIDKILSFTLPQAGERTLICIKKISQTPAKYPRPSAKIAKQPLR
ncbi:MAG: 16S rRNA (guanine(527)-N(7))-methyltransferase RsmG [Clostridia bacterium]|nr:16S rRNA (guanine(527)-N(7))-methyltransferase RsmG [Clostridia bacterium]